MSGISGVSGGADPYSAGISNALATSPNTSLQSVGPFSNLNLTTTQKQQVSQILNSAQSQGLSLTQVQSQINSVLTTSQQTQLQQDMQSRHMHHRHHGAGAAPSAVNSADGTDAFGIPVNAGQSNIGAFSDLGAAFDLQSQLQNGNQ